MSFRRRQIPPEFYQDETIASASPLARLLLSGLWCLADREGRLVYAPKVIQGELFPFEKDINIVSLLMELEECGLISRYTLTPRNSQELPGTPRNSQELPGTPRNSQELPGTPRNSQEFTGIHRNSKIQVKNEVYLFIHNFLLLQNIYPKEMASKLPRIEDGIILSGDFQKLPGIPPSTSTSTSSSSSSSSSSMSRQKFEEENEVEEFEEQETPLPVINNPATANVNDSKQEPSHFKKVINEPTAEVKNQQPELPIAKPKSKPSPKVGNPLIAVAEENPLITRTFTKLYESYPAHRRGDQQQAALAYAAARAAGATPSLLMAALRQRAMSEEWQKDNGKWIPKFVNWLGTKPWLNGCVSLGNAAAHNGNPPTPLPTTLGRIGESIKGCFTRVAKRIGLDQKIPGYLDSNFWLQMEKWYDDNRDQLNTYRPDDHLHEGGYVNPTTEAFYWDKYAATIGYNGVTIGHGGEAFAETYANAIMQMLSVRGAPKKYEIIPPNGPIFTKFLRHWAFDNDAELLLTEPWGFKPYCDSPELKCVVIPFSQIKPKEVLEDEDAWMKES